MQKAEIRKQNKQKRNNMSKEEVAEKSSVICTYFLQSELYKTAKTIMLYMPIAGEVDTSAIMREAFKDGKRVVLPVTDAENNIIPCFAEEDTQFCEGKFSVQEPKNTAIADPKAIDVVIVPGIAFDKSGGRVGFGKGCYDGFLKSTDAVRVGVCYEFQMCEKIPTEPHDEKMDFAVTEKRVVLLG